VKINPRLGAANTSVLVKPMLPATSRAITSIKLKPAVIGTTALNVTPAVLLFRVAVTLLTTTLLTAELSVMLPLTVKLWLLGPFNVINAICESVPTGEATLTTGAVMSKAAATR